MAAPRATKKSGKQKSAGQAKQPPAAANPEWNDRKAAGSSAAIFLAHILGLTLLFDPIGGIFDAQPIIEQDWGLHFHHLQSLEVFWRQTTSLWGYNPWFMAGYPSNTIQDLSIKLFALLAVFISSTGFAVLATFKLLVFLATASIPWLIHFTAKNFFAKQPGAAKVTVAAVALGTVYWWAALPREMFFYGMIGFPLGAYASLLALSLLYRSCLSKPAFAAVHCAWLAAAAVLLPLHFQNLLIIAPAAIALGIIHWRPHGLKFLAWSGAGALVAVLVNLPWLLTAFSHRADDASASIVAQLPLFASTDFFAFITDYLRPGGYWSFRSSLWANGLRVMLLALGAIGLIKLLRSEQRDIGVIIAAALATLFLLTYFGSFIGPLKNLQPLRFKVAYDLFWLLAAAYAIGRFLGVPGANFPKLVLAAGMIAALINVVQTEAAGKMRLRTEISPEVREIVEWVRKETPANGRVLFEESGDETGFIYDGTYLSSLLPHWTGRQLIGGPINLYNDRHHFAEFHSGLLFKRDIASIPSEQLAAYLRLYNIGAVVAFHPRSVQRLQSLESISVDRRLGDLHLMKVNQPLTWFHKGEGDLKAALGKIEIENVRGPEVVLKYHWIEGLRANPPATLVPEKLLDDPIPFIKVVNPPKQFSLVAGR